MLWRSCGAHSPCTNAPVADGPRRFGFNNGQTSLDGLWAGGNAAHSDMATITYQLRLLVGGQRQQQAGAPPPAGWPAAGRLHNRPSILLCAHA